MGIARARTSASDARRLTLEGLPSERARRARLRR